jgi:hypothetical protein
MLNESQHAALGGTTGAIRPRRPRLGRQGGGETITLETLADATMSAVTEKPSRL